MIWTFSAETGWTQRGEDIPVLFANGDVFKARALADGILEIYQNDTLLVRQRLTLSKAPEQNWLAKFVSYVLAAPVQQVEPTETPTETPSPTSTATPTSSPTSEPMVNFALGKSASQSSTYSHSCNPSADKAVDGNTNGSLGGCSVTHTNNDMHAWWQVDLGSQKDISNIQLWNRTDCCSDRLKNYYIFVSDDPFTSTDLNTTLNQAGVSNFYQRGQVLQPPLPSTEPGVMSGSSWRVLTSCLSLKFRSLDLPRRSLRPLQPELFE